MVRALVGPNRSHRIGRTSNSNVLADEKVSMYTRRQYVHAVASVLDRKLGELALPE